MPAALLTHTIGVGANTFSTSAIDTTGATLIVCHVTSFAARTLSDSASNTWTALTIKTSANGTSGQLYYCANPTTSATHTFTLTGTAFYGTLGVHCFSGTATTSAFDAENGNNAGSGTTVQPGSITPSQDGEVIVTGVCWKTTGTGTITISDSMVKDSNAGGGGVNYAGGIASLIQTTAAAINPTWTESFSDSSLSTIACFKAAAAAGVVGPLLSGHLTSGGILLGGRLLG